MTKNIYDQHRAAFANVSAYCIMLSGADGVAHRVATIAFKFPKDGASRLYAYVHWFGVPMVRGSAGGYGYDKCSAACASAARHMKREDACGYEEQFVAALEKDDGHTWERNLRDAGFWVHQAV